MKIKNDGPRRLRSNPSDYTNLHDWDSKSFILADKLFAKALQNFESCLSDSRNLCEKLVSSLESPIIFDEKFKVTSVSIFIADFNLLSWKLAHFAFRLVYWVIFNIDIVLNKINSQCSLGSFRNIQNSFF